MGPPTTGSSANPSLDANVTKDTYIPLFSGAPQDFKEWRKRINIYYKKMELTNRKTEAVLNLIGSLQGTAWRLVEDFNLDDAGKDNAWKEILKKLDAAFQYDSRVQLPNDFDSYFNLQRAPGQTLLQYVTTHDELYRRICDHSITLPGAVQGWHLLRRAGLSKDQRQLVLTQSPGVEKNKVQEALFLLFGQDFKAGGHHHDRRWKGKARGKGYAVYEEEEDANYEEGWDEAYYEFEDADLAENDYDPVEEFDQEAIYYQDEVGDASPLSQEDQQHQVEEYDEAFAAYVDARRRFNDIKLSRGFLPIVALSDPNAGNVSPGLGASSPASSKGVRNDPKLPVDVSCLDRIRVTMMKDAPGSYATVTDDGSTTSQQWISTAWTGVTIFQINGKTRKEMAMVVRQPNRSAGQVAKTIRSQAKKKAAAGAANLSERHMTLDERQAFQQAKMKELQSFFQNSVWEFSTTAEADPARTLSSRMLLKWSRNPDGSPRAKARLIVRGYADLDALEGKVDTAAPTTSRLSRSFLLSVLANCQWSGWTADVSTAFLQGLPQSRKLWVKLPTECLHLLGADENTRMFLNKPCYGQIDAPRRWYLEAVRRLKSLGFRQHLLDPCCFLIYEDDFEEGKVNPTAENTLGPQRLCGMVCIHVDDLLGAGNVDSVVYQRVVEELKKTFNFREWKESNEQETSKLEYCGATLEQYQPHCWKLHHQEYFKKVKPIPLGKDRSPEDEMTPKELSQLRGLLGSLQWPAVQSSPHIQCSTSLISGSMSAGLVKSIVDANKLLRFCKENADVGARYEPLGAVDQLRLVCMFDAAFGVRRDASSQGGYMIMLVPQDTFNGEEKPYHLIDWKSSKLPRIARSSLGAESQAAGQAVDAVDFCSRFWEHLLKPNLGLRYLLEEPSTLKPVMITDAKALYDSYHREGIGGNVTDKRTGLEIRVTKERLQGLDGSFKWISSERQYADGLTKEATRQLLADRIRHGKTKFTWDPLYTAAKKKKLSDRNKSRDEFTTPNTNSTSTATSPTTTLNNNGEKKRKSRSEVRINDEASETGGGDLQTYFAGVDGLIEYVNVSESMDVTDDVMTPAEHEVPVEYEASKNVMVTFALAFLKLLFAIVEFIVKDVGRYYLIAYVMVNLVSGVQAAPKGQCEVAHVKDDDPDDRSLWMFVFAILAGTFVLGFLAGSRRGQVQGERVVTLEPESEIEPEVSVGTETHTDEVVAFQEEIARMRGLVARHENTINMMRAAELLWQGEIGRFRRIRTEAMRIFDRVRQETVDHATVCPQNDHPIFVASRYGTVWHLQEECGHLRHATQVRQMSACEHCASNRFLTPFRYDGDTHTRLVDDVNAWFELCQDTTQLEANMAMVHAEFQRGSQA